MSKRMQSSSKLFPVLALTMAATLAGAGLLYSSTSAQVTTNDAVPGIEHALQLSNAFRHVAKNTLPAVVSISTTGRVIQETAQQIDPFENSPFADDPLFKRFFGNDPQLRQFMERGPMERRRRLPGGQGSGFIISADGTIMTNSHVVANSEEVVVRLSDGREFTANQSDIRSDASSDVAIIRIDVDEQLPFLPLGDDESLEIGDWVLAFGSPFGLHRTVTQGIISAKARGISKPGMNQEFLQTDAAINPGNSGGPLVNLKGEVVGINTAISTSSGGYDGVGFAVPVSLARWVSEQLVAEGEVKRAFLGIQPQEITAELAEAFNLSVPRGIVVTSVVPDTPAAKAGFQEGDVIVEVDGKEITNRRNLFAVIERLQIGQTYPIRVLRDGEEIDLQFTATERPVDEDLVTPETDDDAPAGTDSSSAVPELGIDVQSLTPDLAEQLNVTSSGVVITSVDADSPAAEAGLQTGMVISRVGNTDITSMEELRAGLEAARPKGKALLLVRFRQGRADVVRFVPIRLKQLQ